MDIWSEFDHWLKSKNVLQRGTKVEIRVETVPKNLVKPA